MHRGLSPSTNRLTSHSFLPPARSATRGEIVRQGPQTRRIFPPILGTGPCATCLHNCFSVFCPIVLISLCGCVLMTWDGYVLGALRRFLKLILGFCTRQAVSGKVPRRLRSEPGQCRATGEVGTSFSLAAAPQWAALRGRAGS